MLLLPQRATEGHDESKPPPLMVLTAPHDTARGSFGAILGMAGSARHHHDTPERRGPLRLLRPTHTKVRPWAPYHSLNVPTRVKAKALRYGRLVCAALSKRPYPTRSKPWKSRLPKQSPRCRSMAETVYRSLPLAGLLWILRSASVWSRRLSLSSNTTARCMQKT